jgi:hypothetical protein
MARAGPAEVLLRTTLYIVMTARETTNSVSDLHLHQCEDVICKSNQKLNS